MGWFDWSGKCIQLYTTVVLPPPPPPPAPNAFDFSGTWSIDSSSGWCNPSLQNLSNACCYPNEVVIERYHWNQRFKANNANYRVTAQFSADAI